MTAPGSYANDGRVVRRTDGTWTVSDCGREFDLVPVRHPGTREPVGDLFEPYDMQSGRPVLRVRVGPFDDVVRALIGDPR